MHRFFVSPGRISPEAVAFTPRQSRQIARVLRLRTGDTVEALDNLGTMYRVRLDEVSLDAVRGAIVDRGPAPGEPHIRVHLWQGLLKGGSWEWVLQKGTEVGVSAFHPVMCIRSVAKDTSEGRVRRWGTILQEAAEQSGRGLVPELAPIASWEEACRAASGSGLLLYEGERQTRLREALLGFGDDVLHLLVGPEGGLAGAEVSAAQEQGIPPVTLGPRVLRAETAGVIAAALVLYEKGS